MRWVTATLIVVGLAVGVAVLWPSSTQEVPEDTLAEALTTTTTTAPPADTTTSLPTTTTTSEDEGDTHVVETVEEAEEILRELWFGWFEGIYNQDEERIREVVGNPGQIATAVSQFGSMEFEEQPTRSALAIQETELLRSDSQCLAVWGAVTADFRPGSISGVHVFRRGDVSWLLVNTWPLRGDLWESDCDAVLAP